ncbi:MAG: putative DNA-binding domain-containing protein [Candidatus Omnitrophica bacterium]|nr:putative DNA-binding domain-containing protein [Candidatus Omnitrophota bacterium]
MSGPPLAEVQRWVKSRLRPGGDSPPGVPSDLLNPQRGTPGAERLAVYAGGYVARIRQSLAEAYEAIRHVAGERAFTEMSRGYADRYPSQHYNLSLAGRHLAAFLADWPLTSTLPFLPDLARLEWAVREAFHAFEAPPIDPRRFAQLPLEAWDRARVVFQPSIGLVASAWPILDIWAARTQPRPAVDIDLISRPQRVLVFRQGLEVRCELVDERQHAVLEGLLAGRPLGAVCGELAAQAGDAPPVADWFAGWAARGLIIGCEGE